MLLALELDFKRENGDWIIGNSQIQNTSFEINWLLYY